MPTNYAGVPTATEAPASAPAPGVAPTVVIPNDGEAANAASITQSKKVLADYSAWLTLRTPTPPSSGADGSITLDGVVAAPAWASKVGTVYTMTRDAELINLTVSGAGVILKTANFRLLGSGACTTAAGGVIQGDGPAGSGGTGGTATAVGTMGQGSSGGTNVSNNTTGVAGTNLTAVVGARGGSGGTSSIQAGGAAGTVTAPASTAGTVNIFNPQTAGWIFSTTATWTQVNGGTGGGGGGDSSTTGIGGGGGAGGGVMFLWFRQYILANATDIHCNGGAGGNAVAGGSTGSGGGGGGAGGLLMIAGSFINQTLTAAVNCAGGAGGTATGAGSPGVAGSAGTLVQFFPT